MSGQPPDHPSGESQRPAGNGPVARPAAIDRNVSGQSSFRQGVFMLSKPKCQVIAIEEHYWDPELTRHFTGPEAGRGNDTDKRLYDFADLRIKEMDEAGVDIQVLSHGAPSAQKLPAD